jgi:TPR repeat protein
VDDSRFEEMKKTADEGDAKMQCTVGTEYSFLGLYLILFWIDSALLSSLLDCSIAGVALRDRRDFDEALRYFKLSAEAGNMNAQSNIGLMYFKGEGNMMFNSFSHCRIRI